MDFSDRLYGAIDLPSVAIDLAATCPLLLRLREVRMPNIPFHTYPSFAGVSRYEHSLGVAHLAWRWSRRNGLAEDTGTALTVAALYHDAATPAFSHLYEEFLTQRGFDHESELCRIITGNAAIPGASLGQVFLGRAAKLNEYLPYTNGSSLLCRTGIASIVSGHSPLSPVVSGDIDLDNIDNVLRAVSAMGLARGAEMPHPYSIADTLVWEGGSVRLGPNSSPAVSRWRQLRRRLYRAILGNELEFRSQTSLRWAIETASVQDASLTDASAWTLTEPELVHEHLRLVGMARFLVDRVRMSMPPRLLFSAWTDDMSPLLRRDGGDSISRFSKRLNDLTNGLTYANFYVDKRERPIRIAPSFQKSLFDDDQEGSVELLANESTVGVQHSGISGLVGAVYITNAAVGHPTGASSRQGFRAPELREIVAALRDELAIEPSNISSSWLGDTRVAGEGTYQTC